MRWWPRLGLRATAIAAWAISASGVAAVGVRTCEVGVSDVGTDCAASHTGASLLQVSTADGKVHTRSAVAPHKFHSRKLPEVTALLSAMSTAGVMLHTGLEGATFEHGGHEVRGMRATKDLDKDTKILSVPRAMWIQGTVPAVMTSKHRPAACRDIGDTDMLAQVIMLHEERQKGKDSKFHEYMQALPTLEDYSNFLPALADDSLLQEFSGLNFFVETAQDHREYCDKMFACLEALKPQKKSISHLSLNETVRWILVAGTRRFEVDNERSALIPVSELLNTANVEEINTDWTVNSHRFKIEVTEPVSAGNELIDRYCDDCANDAMLATWGLLLAGNPNPLTTSANCSKLRAPTMAALGLAKGAALPAPHEAKCHTIDGKRCSMALLSLEHCAEKWSRHAKASLVQESVVATARYKASAMRAQQALQGRLVRGGAVKSPRLVARRP